MISAITYLNKFFSTHSSSLETTNARHIEIINHIKSFNLSHWSFVLSIFAFIISIIAICISYKKYRLGYRKPKIERLEIFPLGNTKEWQISFYVLNQSSFGNHLVFNLRRFFFFHSFNQSYYPSSDHESDGGIYLLPPFGKIHITMMFLEKDIKKYLNKFVLLTLKDKTGKKRYKLFKLQPRFLYFTTTGKKRDPSF